MTQLKRSRQVYESTSDEQFKQDVFRQIHAMQERMEQFYESTTAKLMRLDSVASKLTDIVEKTPVFSPATPNLSGYVARTLVPSRLRTDPIKSLWFTKRPYPVFSVFLEDEQGQQVTGVAGWKLQVRLKSGYGDYVDEIFAGRKALQFPFVNGQASVTGLKFLAVTSKNGGHFTLEFSVIPPTRTSPHVKALASDRIRVLSERLYSEIKAEDITRMQPEEKIIHIPGIGRKYSNRFAELGIATVGDLASIDEGERDGLLDLLTAVKKERGTLTEEKLLDIIQDCKTAVANAVAKAEAERAKEEQEQERLEMDRVSLSSDSESFDSSPTMSADSPATPTSEGSSVVYSSPLLFSNDPIIPPALPNLESKMLDPAALTLPLCSGTPRLVPDDTPLLMEVDKPDEWYMVFGESSNSAASAEEQPALKRHKNVWQGEWSGPAPAEVDGFLNLVSIA